VSSTEFECALKSDDSISPTLLRHRRIPRSASPQRRYHFNLTANVVGSRSRHYVYGDRPAAKNGRAVHSSPRSPSALRRLAPSHGDGDLQIATRTATLVISRTTRLSKCRSRFRPAPDHVASARYRSDVQGSHIESRPDGSRWDCFSQGSNRIRDPPGAEPTPAFAACRVRSLPQPVRRSGALSGRFRPHSVRPSMSSPRAQRDPQHPALPQQSCPANRCAATEWFADA